MFAFIAAISQAGGIIVDKIVLTRRRMEVRVFIPVLFLLLFLLTSILMPFLGKISQDALRPYYIIIFISMIVTALVWNIFYYKGAQAEKVHEFELIIMSQPLLTILLAALLIEKNTNIHIIIAAIIASLALITAHLNKMHFKLSKASWGLVLAAVFMSIEIILQKVLLDVFSPAALYFVRTGIIFLFFILYFRPQLSRVSNTNIALVLASASLGVGQMVTKFYGFQNYGVIYTSLVLTLAPILVYILSALLLHEHIKARTIISAAVILGCIVYATALGK